MATLAEYETDIRDKLLDPFGNFYSTPSINRWTNNARRQVAKEGRCVRRLTKDTGEVTAIAVTAGGSGYTTATATISGPDGIGIGFIQATATVTLNAGVVAAITVDNPGTGYVVNPTVTIEGDGSGATATASLTARMTTTVNQEKYDLSYGSGLILGLNAGTGPIQGIQSVSVSWGGSKPTLMRCSFSELQAYLRGLGARYSGWPQWWSPYGQGETGSLYVWPPASQQLQMQWDCYCACLDLTPEQTVDVIPQPWFDAVVYYAAKLAYENAQRRNDAKEMYAEYKAKMAEARAAVSPDAIPDMYPTD